MEFSSKKIEEINAIHKYFDLQLKDHGKDASNIALKLEQKMDPKTMWSHHHP